MKLKEKKLTIKMVIGLPRLSLIQAHKNLDIIKGERFLLLNNENLLGKMFHSTLIIQGKLIRIIKSKGVLVYSVEGNEARTCFDKDMILIIYKRGKPAYAVCNK